jgi:hypothetical protein
MEVVCLAEDELQREVLTKATNFFSRRLGFRRKDVGIIIQPFPGMIQDHRIGANVQEAEPGLMLILLDTDVDLIVQVQHLAHELVHVKQVLSGKLVLERAGRSKKLHYFWKGEDLTHLPYHKRPWEREAMHKEVVLTYELFAVMGLSPS